MKNKIILSLMILMFIALAFNVVDAAVGVTSFYYDKNPLMVKSGEIKDVEFTLQNHGGDADAIVKVALADGEEIAELIDEDPEYIVPLGSSGISVNMRITVPEYAQSGDEWNVGTSFSISYKPKGGGAVQLSSTYFKDFKVIVEEAAPTEPTAQATKSIFSKGSPTFNFILLVIILVIIILLINFITKRKKITK